MESNKAKGWITDEDIAKAKEIIATVSAEKYDIKLNLYGGGFTGQSQALRLAIARALVKINPEDRCV